MIILLLLSLASVWNQPVVGAVTASTATVLVGLDEQDSTRTIYSLDANYGTTSDTVYGQFNKMSLTGLTSDTFYHYKTIVWRGVDADTTDDRTFRTKNTTGIFSFVVIGDPQPTRRTYESVTDSLFGQMRKEHADFVITLGDNIDIRPYWTVDSLIKTMVADTSYHELHAHTDSMFDSVMVCVTLGNHDVFHVNTQAAIDSAIKAYNNAWVSYPALDSGYYWYRWGKCAFVVGNTHWLWSDAIRDRFGATQLGWLETVLNDSLKNGYFNWSFMFFHLPALGGHQTYWVSGYGDYDELDSLYTLIDSAGVDFCFHGHHHLYDYIGKQNNTRYLISGGGNSDFSTTYDYDILASHYLLVNVYPDSLIYYVKSPIGDTLATKRFYRWNKSLGRGKFGKVKL